MSDVKCPFCQRKLKTFAKYKDGTSTLYCSKCNLFGDSKLFSELIRTSKALDVAVDALKRIKFRGEHSKYECCKASGIIAQGALDKITALEQKD